MIEHLRGAKSEYIKLYVKITQETQPSLITVCVGSNDLPGSKNSDEIANEIVKFEYSVKTRENNVAVSKLVSKKE